jgi:hypothetical protein
MQLSAAVADQLVKRVEVPANHLSVLEAVDDLGSDVSAAADGRCIAQDILYSNLLNQQLATLAKLETNLSKAQFRHTQSWRVTNDIFARAAASIQCSSAGNLFRSRCSYGAAR